MQAGAELCRENGVDFVLAVGGGSVIDSAKAIALAATNDADIWDMFEGKAKPKRALGIGCIVTNAASGSETSSVAVISNEGGQQKKMLSSRFIRCSFAIMNPELTFGLPLYQTASGAVDSMMHTIERYFSSHQSMQVTDRIAEGILKTIMINVKLVQVDPHDYDARAKLMWCAKCWNMS